MKINHPHQSWNPISFCCLGGGDCFTRRDRLYMKFPSNEGRCIDLQNSAIYKFDGDEQVQLVEAEISYKYIDSAAKIVYI